MSGEASSADSSGAGPAVPEASSAVPSVQEASSAGATGAGPAVPPGAGEPAGKYLLASNLFGYDKAATFINDQYHDEIAVGD